MTISVILVNLCYKKQSQTHYNVWLLKMRTTELGFVT